MNPCEWRRALNNVIYSEALRNIHVFQSKKKKKQEKERGGKKNQIIIFFIKERESV